MAGKDEDEAQLAGGGRCLLREGRGAKQEKRGEECCSKERNGGRHQGVSSLLCGVDANAGGTAGR